MSSTETSLQELESSANQSAQEQLSKSLEESSSSDSSEHYVSPWLYLGGLSVTLSGLYAINFSMGDPNFALLTYLLAAFGYLTSYTLRSYRVSLKALRVPFFICLALAGVVWLSNDGGIKFLGPTLEGGDKGRDLQTFFLWLAILHSFTLTNNATVLFACVPCMTMIALVSTSNTDLELQNAFLWFSASATFILIHENFLRTHAASNRLRSHYRSRSLFQMQLMMAALCIALSFGLANFVAVPLNTLGSLIPLSKAGLNQSNPSKSTPTSQTPQTFDSSSSISIASGPQSENATTVMTVKEDQPYWLQGTTYDFYSGRSFDNRLKTEARSFSMTDRQFYDKVAGAEKTVTSITFQATAYDLPLEMKKSKALAHQEVTIQSGGLSQYFGAGTIQELSITKQANLSADVTGTVQGNDTFLSNEVYVTDSYVSTASPEELRGASSSLFDFPQNLQKTYLQVQGVDGSVSAPIQNLAEKLVGDATNNYDKVILLKDYMEKNCKYNLQAKAAPVDVDRVEYFLLTGFEGYCDSFAAGLTMLCRYAGIPARVASGYLVQPANRTADGSGFIVQQKDKHVWTEVFFNGFGWIKFDATEGAQDISDHKVAEKSSVAKNTFLKWLFSSGWLPIVMGIGIFILIGYLIKTELWDRFRGVKSVSKPQFSLPETNRQIVSIYLEATRKLGRIGLLRSPDMTPEEFQKFAASRLQGIPVVVNQFSALTATHAQFRYGAQTATSIQVSESSEALNRLVEALKTVPQSALKAIRAKEGVA